MKLKYLGLSACLFAVSRICSAVVPEAPELAIAIDGITATASWSSINGAANYRLFYAPYPYQGEQTIGHVDMGDNTALSVDLFAGAAFYVAVTSLNNDGESQYSNIELLIVDGVDTGGVNSVPTDLELVDISGGAFIMGEAESDYEGRPGSYDALQHTVNISDFKMSSTEITNQQYVEFLNAALQTGLIQVLEETNDGPDKGNTLVYGTDSAPENYANQALLNLSGTRVMKDHDNADADNDPFTGDIEPENPLNISYIGYDGSSQQFFVKDPAGDFDWQRLTDYCDYSTVSHQIDTTSCHNDYSNWPEVNTDDTSAELPTLDEVKQWPATFIRWYGAKAFALFYRLDLPSEAQWEYAARGNNNYVYATADGLVNGDGSSANWNYQHQEPALGHVVNVRTNLANPYGLYNMAGNVWEWMEDWYDADFYANTEASTNPVNNTDSGVKVRRGGSWNYHQATLKSASRFFDEKFKGNDHFGFRVVKNQ